MYKHTHTYTQNRNDKVMKRKKNYTWYPLTNDMPVYTLVYNMIVLNSAITQYFELDCGSTEGNKGGKKFSGEDHVAEIII